MMAEGTLHPAALPPDELLAQCDVQFVRRSGPGGQHRNKVSTGVVLVHRPTGIKAEANERRSQAENRTAACLRLRVNLALEVRTKRGGGRAQPVVAIALPGRTDRGQPDARGFSRRCWPRRSMRWPPANSTPRRPASDWPVRLRRW